jgi:FkbM family methyltransferase
MYSQNEEEKILVETLGADRSAGHFLDIGAYDGKTFSNTLRLAELGWSGVCVEPSPSVFPAMLKLHADNPRIICVNVALSAKSGFTDFYDSGGDAVSTSCVAHRDKWQAAYPIPYKRMAIYTVTPDQLLQQFGYNFDFINLDVEGISYELALLLPFRKLSQVRALCIEHDGRLGELNEYLNRFGFNYVWHNNENVILSR